MCLLSSFDPRCLFIVPQEKARLEADPTLMLGDVTSVNLTIMEGGVQTNVVPDKFTLNFDIRITPTTNMVQFEEMLRGWLAEAGPDVTLEFVQKFTDQTMTSVADSDPWYSAMKKAFTKGYSDISIREKSGFCFTLKTPMSVFLTYSFSSDLLREMRKGNQSKSDRNK